MSVVTVQLGQCGNQIGGQFFHTVSKDMAMTKPQCSRAENESYCQLSRERFFHETDSLQDGNEASNSPRLHARAVMVDMEPKVIAHTVAAARALGQWTYPDKQQFTQKRGSGNNWAYGFCVHGPHTCEHWIDIVRKEVEKCDLFGGFQTMLSLAGGTGSGVGTYVNQTLRDHFPHSFIVNQVVWPYNTGEVIVQNYNAILTLSHLYQSSDAIVVWENDHIQKVCSQLQQIQKVSFHDLNAVIAHSLAGLLQPAWPALGGTLHTGQPIRQHLGEILELLVSHPAYKLLTVRSIPQMSQRALAYSTYQWPGLLKHLRQMLIAGAPMEEGIDWSVKATRTSSGFNRSLGNLVLLRGKDLASADVSGFKEPHLYPAWMSPSASVSAWESPRPLNQYEKSAFLLSNSQSLVAPLERVVDKAWRMFASRAYVHQYLKHGLSEEDFVDSFACLEQILASYKGLT